MPLEEIKHLVILSKYAGERFDLIQAGGGNSSVKLDDGTMLIKASGFALSEVEEGRGYGMVQNDEIIDIISNPEILNESDKAKREILAKALVDKANLTKETRPSIEIFLHSLLKKYTLHTHPLAVVNVVCTKEWRENLDEIFKGKRKFAAVSYKTPGIELAIELKSTVDEFLISHGELPEVIFIQNHGLIVTSDDSSEVIKITDEVTKEIEEYLGIDYNRYRKTNHVSKVFNEATGLNYIAYISDDQVINNFYKENRGLFEALPTCPDVLVFCGLRPVGLQQGIPAAEVSKVLIYKDDIFFLNKNIAKAKEMEEVFKFHLLTLKNIRGEVKHLEEDEISYLLNWEAEKFRQNI